MSMDSQRMGLAVSFPGIDPRVWSSWAIVEAIRIDGKGVAVDVVVVDTGKSATVGLAAPTGRRYGLYMPIEIGDAVVVLWNGASGTGQIVGSMWDTGTPAPAAVVDNPQDAALVGPPGRRLRLLSLDDGTTPGSAVLATGTGPVLLGSEQATAGVARLGDSVEVTIPAATVAVPNPLFPGSGPEFIPNPLPIVLSGTIVSASAKVRSS